MHFSKCFTEIILLVLRLNRVILYCAIQGDITNSSNANEIYLPRRLTFEYLLIIHFQYFTPTCFQNHNFENKLETYSYMQEATKFSGN